MNSVSSKLKRYGDDDLCKLNLGGNSVDIKRSVLTKSKVGWNLFRETMGCYSCERQEWENLCRYERGVDETIDWLHDIQ
jgi:hypothetical protein